MSIPHILCLYYGMLDSVVGMPTQTSDIAGSEGHYEQEAQNSRSTVPLSNSAVRHRATEMAQQIHPQLARYCEIHKHEWQSQCRKSGIPNDDLGIYVHVWIISSATQSASSTTLASLQQDFQIVAKQVRSHMATMAECCEMSVEGDTIYVEYNMVPSMVYDHIQQYGACLDQLIIISPQESIASAWSRDYEAMLTTWRAHAQIQQPADSCNKLAHEHNHGMDHRWQHDQNSSLLFNQPRVLPWFETVNPPFKIIVQ